MFNENVLQQTLRPETVVALQNVPFILKANALSGVQEIRSYIEDVPMCDTEYEEIDVAEAMRLRPDTEERMIVTDRHIIAGGLCYDNDPPDPLEDGTANGKICHRSRYSNDETAEYNAAVGRNRDGSKDFSFSGFRDRLAQEVMKAIRDDLGLLGLLLKRLKSSKREVSIASLKEVVEFSINQEGHEFALDYLADMLYGVSCWCDLANDHQEDLAPIEKALGKAEQIWEEACSAGEIGNPLAVLLDIYEHSGISYSIAGTGMNCRWDTSSAAAVWIPCQDAEDNIMSSVLEDLGIGKIAWYGALFDKTNPLHARYSIDGGNSWVGEGKGWKWKDALKALQTASPTKINPEVMRKALSDKAEAYCKGILPEYNAWRNGWAYGHVAYVIDRETGQRIDDEDDECWGYFDMQLAEEELEAVMLHKALKFTASTVH